ncbi:hypothetical protein GB864_17955, partial [Agromyces sp. MMS17-SY077]|nr:hypothetical protein [Agromyces seonyuensis]
MHRPLRIVLPDRRDAEAVFLALDDGGDAVWLDSGPGATGGHSVIGIADASSARLVVGADGRLIRSDADGDVVLAGSVFDALAESLVADDPIDAGAVDPVAPFEEPGPGWFGWFGYEVGAAAAGAPVHAAETPGAAWVRLDRLVVIDHAADAVVLRTAGRAGDAEWAAATVARIAAIPNGPLPAPAAPPP